METAPKRLRSGSHIRVISPANSMAIISPVHQEQALKVLTASPFHFKVTFSKHVADVDAEHQVNAGKVELRVLDLLEAFADPSVDGILTTIGGFQSNQLLELLDWDVIRSNPKVFMGYSDITCLSNAMLAKAGLVTFSGPHFSTFGMQLECEYTIASLETFLLQSTPMEWITIQPSVRWRNDVWYRDPSLINVFDNKGLECVRPGKAQGMIIGGNVDVLNLLRGTPYFPHPSKDFILFLEATGDVTHVQFDQLLQALLYIPGFASRLKGLVVGRFEVASKLDARKLEKICSIKRQLTETTPIVYGADFGHTTPLTIIPIGGEARIDVSPTNCTLQVRW
ncbi:hypothetical protein HDU91_005184 [Kappamyces sp. JEL0680]|nr:hypothetical protein HDU91_005184 [Kappamyces sp. JEL0680]